MDFDGERYYRINRFFLEIVGLWPYKNSIYIYIYRTFTFSVFASSCLAKMQSTFHDLDRLLYNLTYAVPSHIYFLRFLSNIVHINKVKEMMDRVQHDWNTLKDEREYEIIRYYTVIGMRYTIIFFVISLPLLSFFILMFYLPGFLDLVHPLNESRSRRLPILAEYYILDEQKHFYLILFHQSLLSLFGVIAVLSTETLNMLYVHHACGLFEIASYRLKHVMKDEMSSMCTNKKHNKIHMRIIGAINIHRKAIEFLDYLRSTFTMTYLVVLALGVIAITINMFRLIETILVMNDFEELIASGAFIVAQYSYLFFANYFGQKITDRSILIFEKAYDIPWYSAPVQIQKLLLFMLQRTVKGYVLSISSIVMASLEGFASMASMTLSYLTVIYSVR
ncbi:hypothetical protein HN011_009607 [Eciton burchellii]|nr:hypothetical protein HN011_009607 [Eciton burchellii]